MTEIRNYKTDENYRRLLCALKIDNIKKLDCPDCLGTGEAKGFRNPRKCYHCNGTGEIIINELLDELDGQA